MTILTGPLGLKARHLGRKIGLNSWFAKFLASDHYEHRFAAAIARCVHEGDTVWDVGANTGSYALLFSGRVGSTGRVFAFEPSPQNLVHLRRNTATVGNVVVLPFGLSNATGRLFFEETPDGTTSHIVSSRKSDDSDGLITIDVQSGHEVILGNKADFPNIIKLDVEGYELEVVMGLFDILPDTRLRGIFVEVHFGILEKRGMSAGPREIEKILLKKGFRISWTDPSHLKACRSC